MAVKNAMQKIKSCFLLYFELHVAGSAAELSYYFLFSVFPLVMATSAITFMHGSDEGLLLSLLEALLPSMVSELLSDFYEYVRGLNNTAFFSFGALLALYAIARYVTVIKRKIREIYCAKQEYGMVKEWALSFVIAFFVVLGFYFTFLVQVAGQRILHFLSEHVFFISQKVIDSWLFLRFAAVGLYVFCLLLTAYRFIPNIRLSNRDVLRGALFASVAWIAISVVFSFYVDHISNYSAIYGSIAAFIVLMLWLFMVNNIILIGALINRIYHRSKEEKIKQF